MGTVILTCSSLESYVRRAQEKMHTAYPVIVIDRIYHVEPENWYRESGTSSF